MLVLVCLVLVGVFCEVLYARLLLPKNKGILSRKKALTSQI